VKSEVLKLLAELKYDVGLRKFLQGSGQKWLVFVLFVREKC
jgi:hypothetical protein